MPDYRALTMLLRKGQYIIVEHIPLLTVTPTIVTWANVLKVVQNGFYSLPTRRGRTKKFSPSYFKTD